MQLVRQFQNILALEAPGTSLHFRFGGPPSTHTPRRLSFFFMPGSPHTCAVSRLPAFFLLWHPLPSLLHPPVLVAFSVPPPRPIFPDLNDYNNWSFCFSTYQIMALSNDSGLIEVVHNAKSLGTRFTSQNCSIPIPPCRTTVSMHGRGQKPNRTGAENFTSWALLSHPCSESVVSGHSRTETSAAIQKSTFKTSFWTGAYSVFATLLLTHAPFLLFVSAMTFRNFFLLHSVFLVAPPDRVTSL